MWRDAVGTALSWGVGSLDRWEGRLADLRRTTAFARGRLLFRPRPDDVYVATYPRSGTTWMQFMLHLLVRGPDVEFEHINDVCPWFERSLAVGSMTPEQLEQLPSPRIFKTHMPRSWLPSVGSFVAIVRDPADVALSYYRLYRSYLGFRGSLDDFLVRFEQGRVQYGSYWTHVRQWQKHANSAGVVVLRYEQLREDPAGQLRRVATMAGLPHDDPRIAAAVEGASLPRMKALEARFDHATSLLLERGVTPRTFIGHGVVGAGAQRLSEAQRARIEAAAGRAPREHAPWHLPSFLH